ncbi:hypothetical protein SAMN04487897_102575 [Paenibacillus sp. yr247]|uniref:hypothetical protein n=1 Tax=Paenibacillus sp. yr247 TaxID=1761880 RepID=UPI000882F43A|nr:hypothetical protein [Paenibacillus sp. yr247]SDN34248.1 hypothetical protein SAMN04487897_102575 [Paenibacillus sp. yr247]
MHLKTRSWLRKMRELGWSRQGFGGWISGSEWIAQRGLRQDQIDLILKDVRQKEVRLKDVRQNYFVQERRKFLQDKKHSVHGSNVYLMQPKQSSSTKPSSSLANLEADLWELRKQLVVQIAKRCNGKVRLQDVAFECNVNIRIAAEWLKRFALEGMLSVVAGQRNVVVYSVKDVRQAQK